MNKQSIKKRYRDWWFKSGNDCGQGKDCKGCEIDWELDYEEYVEGFISKEIDKAVKEERERMIKEIVTNMKIVLTGELKSKQDKDWIRREVKVQDEEARKIK